MEFTYDTHWTLQGSEYLSAKQLLAQKQHLRSLISAFVIRFLESIICKLATLSS